MAGLRARTIIVSVATIAVVVSSVQLVSSSSASAADTAKRFSYDALGRLVAATDPAGSTARYTYDADGNITSVSVSSSSQLGVDSIAPISGGVGSSVTITGTGFAQTAGANIVKFNGKVASVTAVAPGELTAQVPAGATSGKISVTVSGTTAASSDSFTVATVNAPTITSFSPNVATPGETVTISGTGFSTDPLLDDVIINKTRAQVLTANTTTLTATVPDGVASGFVGVSTPGGIVRSSTDLFVTPPRYEDDEIGWTGTIAEGQSQAVTVTADSPIALVTFAGVARQHVVISASQSSQQATLELLDPRNRGLLNTLTAFPQRVTAMGNDLTEPGRYTIMVRMDGGGSLTVGLSIPGDITKSALLNGKPVSVVTTKVGQRAVLTFAGHAGDRVSMVVTKVTQGPVDVSIEAPDTALVMNATEVDGAEFVEPSAPLPLDGDYRLIVDFGGQGPGNFTVKLYSVPPDVQGSVTVDGPAKAVKIAAPGQNAQLTFEAAAGDRIALTGTSTTMTTYTDLEIDDPSGDFFYVDAIPPGKSDTWSDVLVMPMSGTYTLKADPEREGTGSFKVQLASVPPDITGTITVDGAPQTLTFVAPGQNAEVTFSGSTGDRIALTTTSKSMTNFTDIQLTTPTGGTLYVDSVRSGQDSSWSDLLTLPEDGTYTIHLDPEDRGVGVVKLELDSVPPDIQGQITIGGAQKSLTFVKAGQNAYLTFSGTAGASVAMTATSTTMTTYTDLEIDDPSGDSIYFGSISPGHATTRSGALHLAVSGIYTIIIDPEQQGTGKAKIKLASAGGDQAASAGPMRGKRDLSLLHAPTRSAWMPVWPSVPSATLQWRSQDDDSWAPPTSGSHDWTVQRPASPWERTRCLRDRPTGRH